MIHSYNDSSDGSIYILKWPYKEDGVHWYIASKTKEPLETLNNNIRRRGKLSQGEMLRQSGLNWMHSGGPLWRIEEVAIDEDQLKTLLKEEQIGEINLHDYYN